MRWGCLVIDALPASIPNSILSLPYIVTMDRIVYNRRCRIISRLWFSIFRIHATRRVRAITGGHMYVHGCRVSWQQWRSINGGFCNRKGDFWSVVVRRLHHLNLVPWPRRSSRTLRIGRKRLSEYICTSQYSRIGAGREARTHRTAFVPLHVRDWRHTVSSARTL